MRSHCAIHGRGLGDESGPQSLAASHGGMSSAHVDYVLDIKLSEHVGALVVMISTLHLYTCIM